MLIKFYVLLFSKEYDVSCCQLHIYNKKWINLCDATCLSVRLVDLEHFLIPMANGFSYTLKI